MEPAMTDQELCECAQSNPKKLLSIGFVQCPSVTPGGKPCFWFRANPMTWLVWSRSKRIWCCEHALPLVDRPKSAKI
jgi:hypothetical protein